MVNLYDVNQLYFLYVKFLDVLKMLMMKFVIVLPYILES